MTAKAPHVGVAEEWEWAGAEDRERDLEEGGWVAQDREPARQGSASAPNAAPQSLINLESRAFKSAALSATHPWSENNRVQKRPTIKSYWGISQG